MSSKNECSECSFCGEELPADLLDAEGECAECAETRGIDSFDGMVNHLTAFVETKK